MYLAFRHEKRSCHAQGYCSYVESNLRESISIQNLLRSQIEGLILSLSHDTTSVEHVERLVRKGIPLVLVDRTADIAATSKVIVDNREAASKATEHLVQQGCH